MLVLRVPVRLHPRGHITTGEHVNKNRGLQHRLPRDMRLGMKMKDNDHLFQFCIAFGPYWKWGTSYRCGTKSRCCAMIPGTVYREGLPLQLLQCGSFQLMVRGH